VAPDGEGMHEGEGGGVHPLGRERWTVVLEVESLTKRYGERPAVDGLTFRVEPGRIVGFLGPNGAGKSTTLRMLLGLAAPTAGTATIDGRRYRDLVDPVRCVGAVLEGSTFHPGRTARDHLRSVALAAGLAHRAGADEGRTILVSSHILAEVAQTVDDVVILHRGRLVAEGPLKGLTGGDGVRVRTSERQRLASALAARGRLVERDGEDGLLVRGATVDEVGDVAAAAGVALHELRPAARTLEDAFLELTGAGREAAR
jgi:ABC-2 type transport system ATP-binding protein